MNSEGAWEKIRFFIRIIFLGFLYGIGLLVLLAMLLQWTLGIDITEFDNIHRLLFLFWGVCVVGWHFYLKNQERKQELEAIPQGREEESEVLVRLPREMYESQEEQSKKNN